MTCSSKPRSPTAISAPDRSSAFAWPCWPAGAWGIEQPRGRDRKRLVTFVEIDRCATDAIGVVTGCRLGKRALKFRDWGKMAASFVDLNRELLPGVYEGIRICALESSKQKASELYPQLQKNPQQMLAYREMPDELLFSETPVQIALPRGEFPGFKGERVSCSICGEGINYDRFLDRPEGPVCFGCSDPGNRYYQPLAPARNDSPEALTEPEEA